MNKIIPFIAVGVFAGMIIVHAQSGNPLIDALNNRIAVDNSQMTYSQGVIEAQENMIAQANAEMQEAIQAIAMLEAPTTTNLDVQGTTNQIGG